MQVSSSPKAIFVLFNWTEVIGRSQGYANIVGRAKTSCLVRQWRLNKESGGRLGRILNRDIPYASQIKEAHQFVVDNYRAGDHVLLCGRINSRDFKSDEYIAIRHLAICLDTGSTTITSTSLSTSGVIPIKFLYLRFWDVNQLQWTGLDRVLLEFPLTAKNILCLCDHDAYVLCRGLYGQVERKETWLCESYVWTAEVDWIMLQTSHIIHYSPNDLVDSNNASSLLRGISTPHLISATTYFNYTKRHGELPGDNAIPTGGQLTRVSKISWHGYKGKIQECLVSSYQSYVEGKDNEANMAPLVGPKSS